MSNSETETFAEGGWDGFKGGKGAVSFWVKVAYRPEVAGGIRSLWDLSRYHSTCSGLKIHKSPFGLWFLPMQGGEYFERALLFGASLPSDDVLRQTDYGGAAFGFGSAVNRVNTIGMPEENTMPTWLGAGRWALVTVVWELGDPLKKGGKKQGEGSIGFKKDDNNGDEGQGGGGLGARIYINGQYVGNIQLGSPLGKYTLWYHDPIELKKEQKTVTNTTTTNNSQWVDLDGDGVPETQTGTITTVTEKREITEITVTGKYANILRLGNPSQLCASSGLGYGGDFPADATFDELYAWSDASTGLVGSQKLWKQGRYFASGLNGDSWVSPNLKFAAASGRMLPPPSSIAAPATTETTVTMSAPVQKNTVRLRGVSFTYYGEETVGVLAGGKPTLKRVLWDYGTPYEPVTSKGGFITSEFTDLTLRPKKHIEVGVEVAILANNVVVKKAGDDGFSEIEYEFDPETTKLRYGVRFVAPGGTMAAGTAILLGTPVFDDITIYYSTGSQEYLEYVLVR